MIMGKNLKTLFMLIFAINMELFMGFQLPKHHNKMVLWRGKIVLIVVVGVSNLDLTITRLFMSIMVVRFDSTRIDLN